jgi:transposase
VVSTPLMVDTIPVPSRRNLLCAANCALTFKRQVAEEFLAGETLHALSKRHDISRQLIRIWVGKLEAGALDEDVQAADLIQEYEAKIAALERMVGRQALEIELLKGALKHGKREFWCTRCRVPPAGG